MRLLPLFAGVFCALTAMGASAVPASGGTIGFRIDADVTAGEEIHVKVTATHTGDESATDVYPEVELLDRKQQGEKVETLGAGADRAWSMQIPGPPLPKGAYTVLIRLHYSDLNGYPFEALSTVEALVSAKPGTRVSGAFRIAKMLPKGTATGTLALRRPPARTSSTFEGTIAAPAGVQILPEKFPITFDDKGNASVELTVANRKLLAGTSVNIFALVTGNDQGLIQTDPIRGTVSVGTAPNPVSKVTFYGAAAAVAALLLLLETGAWFYRKA